MRVESSHIDANRQGGLPLSLFWRYSWFWRVTYRRGKVKQVWTRTRLGARWKVWRLTA